LEVYYFFEIFFYIILVFYWLYEVKLSRRMVFPSDELSKILLVICSGNVERSIWTVDRQVTTSDRQMTENQLVRYCRCVYL